MNEHVDELEGLEEDIEHNGKNRPIKTARKQNNRMCVGVDGLGGLEGQVGQDMNAEHTNKQTKNKKTTRN